MPASLAIRPTLSALSTIPVVVSAARFHGLCISLSSGWMIPFLYLLFLFFCIGWAGRRDGTARENYIRDRVRSCVRCARVGSVHKKRNVYMCCYLCVLVGLCAPDEFRPLHLCSCLNVSKITHTYIVHLSRVSPPSSKSLLNRDALRLYTYTDA